ncbi:MAG: sodium:proton antiporter, partial [Planctomycetota bacterium]
MAHDPHATPSRLPALIGIGLVLIAYFGFVMVRGVESLPGAHHDDSHAAAEEHGESHGADEHGDDEHGADEHGADEHGADEHGADHAGDAEHGDTAADGHGHGEPPHWVSVIPFVLLLGGIAILPLIPATEHWWESNANRFLVAVVLATITLLYYMFVYSGGGFGKVKSVLDHAILGEYIPFIVLLFSLYTISGGIRIQGDLVASPFTNTMFLLVGGALASFVGTTGAAMLLIRPLIETNNERTYRQHTVVFFIFVVCNCGGCLLPIGDPPLFLGYLKGVSFLWTMEYLWSPWLVANILILAIYYVWDRFFCYPRESGTDVAIDKATVTPLSIRGLLPNLLLLLGVVLSVALLAPTKPIMGWYPWPFLREIVQLALV